MFFDLFNALINFQSYINKILAKNLNIFVIIYLDNIFFYIKDLDQLHIDDVLWVLQKLKRYSFFAYRQKC